MHDQISAITHPSPVHPNSVFITNIAVDCFRLFILAMIVGKKYIVPKIITNKNLPIFILGRLRNFLPLDLWKLQHLAPKSLQVS